MIRPASLALALAIPWPACAVSLAPAPDALQRAAGDGAALAARHEGYKFGRYVLHEVKDARALDPADGAVDAIVLATQIERTRHAAYLAAYSGRSIGWQEAWRTSGLAAGAVAIIVFAHGDDDDDVSFTGKFGEAELALDGGPVLRARPVASEPTETVYPLARAPRERMVATLTYRFDLAAIPRAGQRQGRLRFTDSTGKTFDLAIAFAAFD